MLRKHFEIFVFIISNAMFVFVLNISRDLMLVFEFLFCLVIDLFLFGVGGWGVGGYVFGVFFIIKIYILELVSYGLSYS